MGIGVTADLSMKSISTRLAIADFSRLKVKSFASSMINFVTVCCTLLELMSNVFNCVIETVKLVPGMSTARQMWEIGSCKETKKWFRMSEIGNR